MMIDSSRNTLIHILRARGSRPVNNQHADFFENSAVLRTFSRSNLTKYGMYFQQIMLRIKKSAGQSYKLSY
jgi:hypothetical protein